MKIELRKRRYGNLEARKPGDIVLDEYDVPFMVLGNRERHVTACEGYVPLVNLATGTVVLGSKSEPVTPPLDVTLVEEGAFPLCSTKEST